MSSAPSTSAWASRAPFLLRKLHSLTGVVPLGVFLAEHLWTNASALGGQKKFDDAVGVIQRMPLLPVIEWVGIFLPLLFHAVFGIYLSSKAQANVGHYTYARNWAYVLQRITGVLVFLFIAFHLWEYRIQKWLFGMGAEAFYPTLATHLSTVRFGVPGYALLYLVGIAAATYHFANGLVGFCASWGITTSRKSQKRAAWLFGSAGVLLFVLGTQTVLYFATGSRLYLGADAKDAPPSCEPQTTSPASPTR